MYHIITPLSDCLSTTDSSLLLSSAIVHKEKKTLALKKQASSKNAIACHEDHECLVTIVPFDKVFSTKLKVGCAVPTYDRI